MNGFKQQGGDFSWVKIEMAAGGRKKLGKIGQPVPLVIYKLPIDRRRGSRPPSALLYWV